MVLFYRQIVINTDIDNKNRRKYGDQEQWPGECYK